MPLVFLVGEMNHAQRLQHQPDQFSRSVRTLQTVSTFSANPRLDRVRGNEDLSFPSSSSLRSSTLSQSR